MRFRFLPILAGLCVLLSSGASLAQSGDPLRLRDAVRRAVEQQPELRGFVFDLRAQEARIAEAGLRPPVTAGLLVEDAGGTGQREGFDSAQTTLSLSHVIELGGKREARVEVAEALRTRLQTQRAARQLDVAAEVARRFVETLHERERLRIAEEGLQQAETTQDAVGRRVQAALAPAAEIARAEVRIAQARLDLEHAEHQLENSRVFLAAAMGERTVRFGETEGDLYALEALPPLETLAQRVEQSPDLTIFVDEARLRDSQVRLALMQRRADLRAEVGVRRYEQGDDVALIAGFSVPLFSGQRARSGVDVAEAEREKTDADREAVLLRIHAQLFAQYREMEHAELEARTLRTSIIPQLQNALDRTEYAYQRGRYSYLELTDAQRELLAARQRLADIAANFHLLRIEIERLTGQSLETVGVSP